MFVSVYLNKQSLLLHLADLLRQGQSFTSQFSMGLWPGQLVAPLSRGGLLLGSLLDEATVHTEISGIQWLDNLFFLTGIFFNVSVMFTEISRSEQIRKKSSFCGAYILVGKQ